MEKRASPQQFLILLEFMERNGDLSKPEPGLKGRIRTDRLWTELTELLNSTGEYSVQRTNDKWKRVWSDWKNKTKKKATIIKRHNRIGGDPSKVKHLTPLEKRVLQVMRLNSVNGNEDRDSAYEVPIVTEMSSTSPPALDDLQDEFFENPSCSQQSEGTPISRLLSDRQRYLRQLKQRRQQAHLSEAIASFARLEEGRLKLEEMRLIKEHERELERMRLETLRIGIEERRNDILQGISVNLMELLAHISRS